MQKYKAGSRFVILLPVSIRMEKRETNQAILSYTRSKEMYFLFDRL